MRYYAIIERATGRCVSGTDFSRADGKPRQIFASDLRPPLLLTSANLDLELKRRRINLRRYKVCIVEIALVDAVSVRRC